MPLVARANNAPTEDVQADLGDVEQVQCHRRAETDLGPVPGHRPDPLRSGSLTPLFEVENGHFLLEKPHDSFLAAATGIVAGLTRILPPNRRSRRRHG